MNLVSLLAERADRHPERLALVDRLRGADRAVSYGELSRRVRAGAAKLQKIGLKRGDVVLVFQPVSIELYEFLLAAFHAGLQVMLADPSAGREFLNHCCERMKPQAFFGSWKAQILRLTVSRMRSIPLAITAGPWFPRVRSWETDGDEMAVTEMLDDDPALVTFTSGSTGQPKAAVRTHGFLLAQHRVLSRSLDFNEGEVDLITLPVFVLANLASGLTSVLAATDLGNAGSPDAEAIFRQCDAYHVTRCAASPAFFTGLLNFGKVPAFQKLYTGGAPVFPELLRRLQIALPESGIHAVYGSTEAEPIAHFSATEASAETDFLTRSGAGLCSGVPVDEIELRIIADRWGAPLTGDEMVHLSDGEVGEIVVSGDHVLRGYLDGRGDEETKIHAKDGIWHRTGDAGWMDPHGRIWLLGRCAEKLPPFPAREGMPKDALRYPFAIECALRELFPNIRMAALEWKGQRVLVVGARWDEKIATRIAEAAAEFGMTRMIYLESLPLDRRHQAKIDYPALRKLLEKF